MPHGGAENCNPAYKAAKLAGCRKEFIEGHDEVRLIFDGAGTRWIGELAKPEHRAHGLYEAVKHNIAGVCAFCAAAFGAREAVRASGLPLLDEYEHHTSLRKLVTEGFQVITF
ncbi:MAG: DsrE family protein [Chloroflexi bacterium]|nr:DsrE family protein [Chloroflexota bacterium]